MKLKIISILLIILGLLIISLILFQKDRYSKERYQVRNGKLEILVLCAWKNNQKLRLLELDTINQFLMENYTLDEVNFTTLNILPENNDPEYKADLYIDKNYNLYDSTFTPIDNNQFIHHFDFIILETCPWVDFDPEIQDMTYSKLKSNLHFSKLKKGGFYLIFSDRFFGLDPNLTPFENFEKRSKSAKEYLERFYNIFNNYLEDETTQILNGVLIMKNIKSN